MREQPEQASARGNVPCPICRRPSVGRYRPFCSPRCADVDLGRWFTEAYRAPTSDSADPGEAADHDADAKPG